MAEPTPPSWPLLAEILRRPFSPTQVNLLLHLAELTVGRGHGDVAVASIEQLAQLCGSARPHVSPVVDELVGKMVIGRDERAGTWWLLPVDLWHVQPDQDLDAARAAVIDADEARRSQGEWWPQPTAADLAPSEFLTPPPSEILTTVRISDARSGGLYRTRAPEPGNQKPDNQVRRGKGTGLDAAGWHLLHELVEWCSATGETCSERQRTYGWGWRVWTQPLVIQRALLDAQRHVANGKSCKSRFGLVKHFWREAAGDDKLLVLPPRSADRLHGGTPAHPAGGECTAPEPAAVAPPPEPGALRRAVLEQIARDRAGA